MDKSQFLDLLESYNHHDASQEKIFGGEGVRIRGKKSPQYLRQLAEAAQFVARVYQGTAPVYRFQEAMTTSDFPLLFGDIIDRQLLANYQEGAYSWSQYAKRGTVRDFRQVKRFYIDGASSTLAIVGEKEEYPESKINDGKYQYAVQKYGRRIPFSWESMVNDDLDALKDIPERFGRASRRTEEKFVTALFANNGTFFSTAHKNVVSQALYAELAGTNPPLTASGLQDAMIVLARQTDTEGEPINMEALTLVVPPSLDIQAQNIMHAAQIWLNDRGGTTNERLIVQNWLQGRVTIAVNTNLPLVDGSHGTTGWYLFASPSAGRPAMEVGFLRGHETPETFMKEPNARRIGGGAGNPMDGDFDTDSIHYKIRHVIGGTMMEPRAAVYSNGSGS